MTNISGLRIVVAEDDDLNLLVILKMLKEAGHIVTQFEDGDLALEYLLSHPLETDIVILDKMMLRMSGLEVVGRMKEHHALKNIPIIIQSGDSIPERIKEAVDTGIDRYITKPFTQDELLELVNELSVQYKITGHPAEPGNYLMQ